MSHSIQFIVIIIHTILDNYESHKLCLYLIKYFKMFFTLMPDDVGEESQKYYMGLEQTNEKIKRDVISKIKNAKICFMELRIYNIIC